MEKMHVNPITLSWWHQLFTQKSRKLFHAGNLIASSNCEVIEFFISEKESIGRCRIHRIKNENLSTSWTLNKRNHMRPEFIISYSVFSVLKASCLYNVILTPAAKIHNIFHRCLLLCNFLATSVGQQTKLFNHPSANNQQHPNYLQNLSETWSVSCTCLRCSLISVLLPVGCEHSKDTRSIIWIWQTNFEGQIIFVHCIIASLRNGNKSGWRCESVQIGCRCMLGYI